MNIFILIAIGQLFLTLSSGNVVEKEPKRVVCYYVGLDILPPENINATLCTHLVYLGSRYELEREEGSNEADDGNHNSTTSEFAEKLLKLREVNPKLKLLLMSSLEMLPRDKMTPTQRLNIIEEEVAFIKRIKFDGLEFINMEKKPIDYTEDIAELLCEMQSESDKHGFTVSAMLIYKDVPKERNPVTDKIARCCDFISFSTLEFWGPWMHTANLLSTLTSIKSDVDKYLEIGIPSNKLLVPIPAFAKIGILENMNQNGFGASISSPANNKTGRYHVPYQELMKAMKDPSEEWTLQRDEENNAPYAYNNKGHWATYDDPSSVATKAHYVLKKNLGGAVLVPLDMDDTEGIGGKGKFPLTRTIHETFNRRQEGDNST